jgi:hypothetical protein
MDEAKEARVSSLLQEGLELYGTGDVARAFLLWNEALELDPSNEEALDYIRDADRRDKPRGEVLSSASLLGDARRILRSDGPGASLEFLMAAGPSGVLEVEAMIELLRADLFQLFRTELGSLDRVPHLVEGATKDLHTRNLPPSAAFLLSMIDGMTPLGDLLSLSGMDRFDSMRSLYQMRQAEIVEWSE